MKVKKKFLQTLGYFLALGNNLVLSIIFLLAYINPEKKVEVFINRYGEANIELIIIPALLIFSTIMFLTLVLELIRDVKGDI